MVRVDRWVARAGVGTRLVLLAVSMSVMLGGAAVSCARSSAAAPAAREATGVIRGFGADRSTVRIAHDDIPGYMKAMTMTFDAKAPSQLEGLEEKDAVTFAFTEESDGRYLLLWIRKR